MNSAARRTPSPSKAEAVAPSVSPSAPALTEARRDLPKRANTRKKPAQVSTVELLNSVPWVDRIAKELRAQREWSERWSQLSRGMSPQQPTPPVKPPICMSYPEALTGQLPTHRAHPRGKFATAQMFDDRSFKITGDRSKFLSSGASGWAMASEQSGMLRGNNRAEGATRASETRVFPYPPTTSMEYGWAWGCAGVHRPVPLERFGSTSANFARESWKRVTTTNKNE
ncbi:hypothetical protein DFJ73DRAFT_842021 [Zopfochytrium polystomum]|nr:hypothetical protein DFJ73DRAFT_842021 [Zopfochytrium polystomum]